MSEAIELSVPAITVAEAQARVAAGAALLVDVRRPESREQDGFVPGAFLLAKDGAAREADAIRAQAGDRELIVYCNSERGSDPLSAQLRALGFERIVQIAGGFPAWRAAGGAVEPRR